VGEDVVLDPVAERVREQIKWELDREGPPAGFPAFHRIPIGRYVDDEFWELERDHLWPKVWVMAGRAEQVPDPGDYLTFDDLAQPILVVRGKDGVVRAFYNTCQHRGAPVVRDARGTARNLRCQYHGWTYDITEGRLVSVPDERDFVDFCRGENGLVQISCEVWGGWIFVNEDPGAAPLRAWFDPVLTELEQLAGDTLQEICRRSQVIECNWKVTAEAFLEVYHFRHIHARGAAGRDTLLNSDGAVMTLFPNGCSRMIVPYSRAAYEAQGMTDWSDWEHRSPSPFVEIPTVGPMIRSTSSAYNLFPNVITPVSHNGFPFLLFWPIDKRTTHLEWVHYAPKHWDGDELPDHWQRRMDTFDMIMEEDRRNMAPMQRSLESPAMRGVQVNYQERRIWNFHEQVDRTIGIDRIPERYRVEQVLAPFVQTAP
jgi:phenylpropionate dioxygenase-like ring-hydroxylating dioxygenase large terminal subunit